MKTLLNLTFIILVASTAGYCQDWNVELVGGIYSENDLAIKVCVHDNFLYVADGYAGMKIVDISDENRPFEISQFDTPGRALNVKVVDGNAFIADSSSIIIVDVSSPDNPSRIGIYEPPGYVAKFAISGNYLYFPNRESGLRVVDISDPRNPRQVGIYNSPSSALAVAVQGNYAYLADKDGGLRILDISDPTHPEEVGFEESYSAQNVTVAGDYAYVAHRDQLLIFDVSDPVNPTRRGWNYARDPISDMVVIGNYAYLAVWDGLQIYDVSTPRNPREAGLYNSSGIGQGVAVAGDLAFLADTEEGVAIIDISNPTQPQKIAYCLQNVNPQHASILDGFCYISAGLSGIRIIDINNLNDPVEARIFPLPHDTLLFASWARSIAIINQHAFITDGNGRIVSLDISTPENPRTLGTRRVTGSPMDMSIGDSVLFVLTESDPARMARGGVNVMNVSDPSRIRVAGFFELELHGIELVENHIVGAGGATGLVVLDVSDYANITLVANCETPGYANDVAYAAGYAFIADSDSGLSILDISDMTNPVMASNFPLPAKAYKVVVSGDFAFVSADTAGLRIVNVSDPRNPYEVGYYETPYTPNNLAVEGNYVFLTSRHRMEIFDCSAALAVFQPFAAIPLSCTLRAPYPNPFNSQTNIVWEIPKSSAVKVEIRDLTGREFFKLFDGAQQAGRYEAIWDAAGVPAGVYLVRMNAGEFAQTRKLTLVK